MGDSVKDVSAGMGVGAAGGYALTSAVEGKIQIGMEGSHRMAAAGGAAFIQGAYGRDSQQARNYAAFQLSRTQRFKENTQGLYPDMNFKERNKLTFEIAKMSVNTDIGRDGNAKDYKVLNKAVAQKREIQAKLMDTKNVSKKSAEEAAARQVEDRLAMSRKYLQKDIEKQKDQIKDQIVEQGMKAWEKANPRASAAEKKKVERETRESAGEEVDRIKELTWKS